MKYLLLLLHTAVRHTLGKFYLSSPLFYFIVRARSGSVSLCTWAHSPRSKTAKTQAKNTHSLGLGWTPLFLDSRLFSLLLLLLFFFSFFFSTTTCTIQALVKTRENQTERTNFVPTEFSPHSKGLLPPATPEYCHLNGKVSTILSLIVF